jgi:hypothetical protein
VGRLKGPAGARLLSMIQRALLDLASIHARAGGADDPVAAAQRARILQMRAQLASLPNGR